MEELSRTKLQKIGGRVRTHQPTLRLTASLLKKESVELMWVANVDCTITTLDAHQPAHDLGLWPAFRPLCAAAQSRLQRAA